MKKGLVILPFVLGLPYAGLFSFPASDFFPASQVAIPDPHEVTVPGSEGFIMSRVEIIYEIRTAWEDIEKHYTIEYIYGEYYSNGEIIDSQLIDSLAESFTDFYESDAYEMVSKFKPALIANITLENGKSVILKSGSRDCCFMPWNIVYNGKFYVQYSGQIPSALLRLLTELDKDQWQQYDKEARWGCYPLEPPEKYSMKGLSDEIPRSEPATQDERNRLVWETNVGTPLITKPVYSNGRVFALTEKQLISLDAETGKIVWEVNLERDGVPLKNGYLLLHEGALYGALPLKNGYLLLHEDGALYTISARVIKVDTTSGDLLWEYDHKGFSFQSITENLLWIYKDTLLVSFGRTVCLDIKTGEEIWVIPQAEYGWLIGDRFLFAGVEYLSFDDESFCCLVGYYYGFADVNSGRVIRKLATLEYAYCGHHDEIVYLDEPAENTLVSLNTQTTKKEWSYKYEEALPGYGVLFSSCKVCKSGVLLSLYPSRSKGEIAKLLFFDRTGSKVWEYTYGADSVGAVYPYIERIEVFQGILYLVREEGFIEAFNVKNGKKLWEREVRGYIQSFQIYDNELYISADDCMLYCLDAGTGEIVWKLAICEQYYTYDRYHLPRCSSDYPAYVSDITGDIIFVSTENTLIAVSVAG